MIVNEIDVRARMQAGGFVSLYHNAGAWGFERGRHVETVGWIGAEDATIRPEARGQVRQIPAPFAINLARLAEQAWLSILPGEAWLNPKSHWHYELEFGNRELLESLLPAIGIDPLLLRDRNGETSIVFAIGEAALLRQAIERLLADLRQSDFQITFPEFQTVCTIHHHQQLWWQTTAAQIAAKLLEN